MKKLIICAAVVLAAGLMTSCNRDTNYCWEMTYSAGGFSVNNYIWGTQNELDAAIAEVKQEMGNEVKITYKRTSKAQSECYY